MMKMFLLGCLLVTTPTYARERTDLFETPDASAITLRNSEEQRENIVVTGKVLDKNGAPIVGASVVEVNGTKGTMTNANGEFSISLDKAATLSISFLGYTSQTVNITQDKKLIVTLLEEETALSEMLVVGYGKQRVETVTGSVSQIKTKAITVAPLTNITQTLAGQLPGLITKQTSGLPGKDDVALQIRGYGDPLIIVDGVESGLSQLDPNQVETISILKDGAASIYGARAGNGVILVTTKRGSKGKPVVQLNSSVTLQNPTKIIGSASSAQRAQYLVDSHLNSGGDPALVPYTEEQIQKFREGNDPNYLNTDWFGATIRKFSPQHNHNVSVSGGTDNVKYFGYFAYNSQETLFKTNGGKYDRFNFQANFDAKVSKQLSVGMDIQYVKTQNLYTSGADMSQSNVNFWQNLIYAADPKYPLYLPDRSYMSYAGITYGNPLFATNGKLAGYFDTRGNQIQYKADVTYDSKFVKGLSAKGSVILRDAGTNDKLVKKQEKFYTYNWDSGDYTFMRSSQDAQKMDFGSSNTEVVIQQYSLNYERTFNHDHTISAMAMYESILTKTKGFNTGRGNFNSMAIEELFGGDPQTAHNSSWSSAMGRISWVGRLNYSYQDKYVVETTFRADASSRFAKGHRWGYFPSISAGWNIAREDFMRSTPIDLLKLRASYGESGYDNVANFAFLTGYSTDIRYTLGDILYSTLLPTGLANIDLSWEKMSVYNVGLDFSLWNRKLYGEAEYFYRKRTGIPGQRTGGIPSSFGASLPQENLNAQHTAGFEIRVGTAGRAGDFSYDITGNIAYTVTKWDFIDEAAYTDPDEIRLYKKTGRKTDRQVGYVFDGLFTSQEEIDNWNLSFDNLNNDNSSLRPGDVKYKDLNNDGVINWRDQTEIGLGSMPHWTFGVNLNLGYKQFDLSALFQGAFDYTTMVNLEGTDTKFRYDNYWHETRNNDANALIPRPSGSVATNYFTSTYRTHNTAYMRLKYLSIGYELPQKVLSRIGISRVRFYMAGTNLFTLSSLHKYNVDPEMPAGNAVMYYPQQRTVSLGVNLTF